MTHLYYQACHSRDITRQNMVLSGGCLGKRPKSRDRCLAVSTSEHGFKHLPLKAKGEQVNTTDGGDPTAPQENDTSYERSAVSTKMSTFLERNTFSNKFNLVKALKDVHPFKLLKTVSTLTFALAQICCCLRHMPGLTTSPAMGRAQFVKVSCNGHALRREECLVIATPA